MLKVYTSLKEANQATHGYYTRELNRIFGSVGGWRLVKEGPNLRNQNYYEIILRSRSDSSKEVIVNYSRLGWAKPILEIIERELALVVKGDTERPFYDPGLIEEAKELVSSMGMSLRVLDAMTTRGIETSLGIKEPNVGLICWVDLGPSVLEEIKKRIEEWRERANRPPSRPTAEDEYWAHFFSGSLSDFD